MRKRVTFCVLPILFFSPFTALFSQLAEVSSLTSGNFISSLQYNFTATSSDERAFSPGPVSDIVPSPVTADKALVTNTSADDELLAMQTAISNFFHAMESGKIEELKESCIADVSFKTHLQDQTGNHYIFDESINDLIPFVAKSGSCFNIDIRFELLPPDPATMQFRAPYTFYINGEVSHCGVSTFELEKADDLWKIKQMVDTRSRSCK